MSFLLKRVCICLALLVSGGAVGLFSGTAHAKALSGSDFSAGNIIDNSVFYNQNSMSQGQIQQFLNNKMPSCDTSGTQTSEWGGGTRAQYGTAHGHPPPYTCLKDYWENPDNGQSNYGGAATPAGAKSAAQIVYDAAQANHVNPQVLLTIMERESALITDSWPWPVEYNTAMGYACPDTGPNHSIQCNSGYFGFAEQVTDAAHQLKLYAANPGNYNFLPNANNFIQWSPQPSCGGSTVFIQNIATASLYDYAPYQPNGASLANLYGSGDACSSDANRNFWVYFNNWFGSPTNPNGGLDQPAFQHRTQTVQVGSSIYVFYYDAFQRVLRVASQSTGAWQYSILDGSSGAGGGRIDASLGSDITATEFGGYLQVFYYDQTHGMLRHAWTDANGWHFENLDGDRGSIGARTANVGKNPTVLKMGNYLQLFYGDLSYGDLRHAWTDANGWHFENLDGDRGSIGARTANVGTSASANLDSSGHLQVFYYDGTYGLLRHAWADGNGWHFENLDGDRGSIGARTANVGLNPTSTMLNGSLQLFYYDASYNVLRHAWADGNGWHFENLDGDRGSIAGTASPTGILSSVTSFSGNLQLLYYDMGNGNTRHAWADGNGWHFENLDGDTGSLAGNSSDVGLNSTITSFGTSLQSFYYDRGNGNLRHAWADGNGWHFENLDNSVVY